MSAGADLGPSRSPFTEEGGRRREPGTEDIGRLLAVGRKRLEDAGADAPWLTALVSLEHAAALDRATLLAHPESRPQPDAAETYMRLLERRCRREPLAYVLGHRDFWGRRFEVSRATLIPRPETERIVEMALEWLDRPARPAAMHPATPTSPSGDEGAGSCPRPASGLDVGTGCGSIAVSLLAERAGLSMVATDLDVAALRVASRNAQRHGVAGRLRLVACHLASAVSGRFPLVVANLPYIPTSRMAALEPEIARFEPRRALDGGSDGMRVVASLLAALPGLLAPGGLALVEIGDDQSEGLTAVARRQSRNFAVRIEPDATGAKRFLAITNREP